MSILRYLGLICLVLFVTLGTGQATTTPCFINAVYTNQVTGTVYNLCERYLAFYTTLQPWHPEIPGFPADMYSAVYTFQFTPVSTTTVFFILADTMVFKVNGVTYITLTGEGFFARQISVTLPDLSPMNIELQFFETSSAATLVLQWLNNGFLTPFFDRIQPCGTTVGLPTKWWYQMNLDEFGAAPDLDPYCEFAPGIPFGNNRAVVFDVPGFPVGQVSGRMEGCIRAPVQNRPVTFQQTVNDGARYYLNGLKLSDTWSNDGTLTVTDNFVYTFTAPAAAIRVEFRQNGGRNVLTTQYDYQGYLQYVPLDDYFPKGAKSCPSTINTVATSGTCTKAVSYATPTFASCTPAVVSSNGHASGSLFPLGTTNVVLTGTFDGGQTDTCAFNVVVADHGEIYNTACPSSMVVPAGPACSATATWAAVTFSACDTYSVTNSHTPGQSFGLGATTVTYVATHSVSGAKATCQFTVTVTDQTPPQFTACSDVISNVPCDVPTTLSVAATDNCNQSPVITQVSGPSGSIPLGTSRVSFTASDGVQTSSCSFNVIRNCFDVTVRMKNFAPTSLTVGQAFTVQVIVGDTTSTPVFDMEVNFVDTVQTLSINGPGTYEFTSLYDHAGIRCIKVCLDDKRSTGGCSAQYRALTCISGSKRATTGASLQVNVQSQAGGDPHFLGFDGKIYDIDGVPGHVYNLLSSPQLQINALFDEGWGEEGHLHKMKDVLRAVSVMWEEYAVTFQVDHNSNFNGSVWSSGNNYPLSSSSESFYLGSVRLDWEPVANATRQDLMMSRHNEVNHLTLRSPNQFQVDLEAVWLESHHSRYFFVDLQVSFAEEGIYKGEVCLEGLWGRTSCLHKEEDREAPAQLEKYDLNGDLLRTAYPLSLFAKV